MNLAEFVRKNYIKCKDGEEFRRFTGLQQEATLAEALEEAVTSG